MDSLLRVALSFRSTRIPVPPESCSIGGVAHDFCIHPSFPESGGCHLVVAAKSAEQDRSSEREPTVWLRVIQERHRLLAPVADLLSLAVSALALKIIRDRIPP